jgi:2-oxoglutarate ferredoxin oxidoreductase subunit gamma
MAALGAYVGGKGVVSLESVIVALRRMIPEHRKELLAVNEEALRRGSAVAAAPMGQARRK